GKRRRFEHRGRSAWLEKRQPVVPADFVLHADAPVKLDQISAATQQNVLAVVHHLARTRMLIGRSAPAEIRAALEKGYAESAIGEGTSGSQPRQAASDDGHPGRLCPALGHQVRRFTKPFPRMTSFS